MRSPSWSTSPSTTCSSVTVPACSVRTGISIFIDSRITSVSPAATGEPGVTSTFQTLDTISAWISSTATGTSSTSTPGGSSNHPPRAGRTGSGAGGGVSRGEPLEDRAHLAAVVRHAGLAETGERVAHRARRGRRRRRRPR